MSSVFGSLVPPVDLVPPAGLGPVHFIAVGGAGMSGIARILLARGYRVTGSDMKDSRSILALRSAGATVEIGHAAENLRLGGELPTVVVTSFAAIPQDNPELVAAREAGIPVLLVGDSAGNNVFGFETTVPVTVDHLLPLVRVDATATSHAMVVADLPCTVPREPAAARRAASGRECVSRVA